MYKNSAIFAKIFPQRFNLNKPIDETAAKRKTTGVNAKSKKIKFKLSILNTV